MRGLACCIKTKLLSVSRLVMKLDGVGKGHLPRTVEPLDEKGWKDCTCAVPNRGAREPSDSRR